MKKIKYSVMGKRLKDIYPHATPFQVFKYRVRRFILKLFVWSAVAGCLYGAFSAGKFVTPSMVYQAAAETITVDNLTPKIESLKEEVIKDIKSCETPTKVESDGVITFDTNKRASIGLMQFQITTVQHYYKVLYQKDITRKDAVLVALDKEKAEQLATDIIFSEKDGWRNWFNCGVKFKIAEKVAIIKQLEK